MDLTKESLKQHSKLQQGAEKKNNEKYQESILANTKAEKEIILKVGLDELRATKGIAMPLRLATRTHLRPKAGSSGSG